MRRLVISAILVGSLVGPVHAQKLKPDDPLILETEQRKKDAIDIDKQYKSTLEKTRQESKAVHSDPWSNMRGSDDSKVKR